MSPAPTPPSLLGQAASFLALMEQVSRAAPLNRPTLVIGERGTGKELVAARLHYLSPRWDKPFIKLNCAALSETLLETELFGHERGAFTGASGRHAGRFELADGGTLFLDEIATSSAAVQEKILRVIEYGEFERVGGSQTVTVDVRVVGATNADLPRLADAGRFRADLLDRLSFDVLTIPPLRARGEDIPLLAETFGIAMARELGRPYFQGFAPAAMAALQAYEWPGNVRELKNVVERAIYRAQVVDRPIEELVFDPFVSPYRPTGEGRQVAPAFSPSPPPVPSQAPPQPPLSQPQGGAVGGEPGKPFLDQVAAFEVGLLRAALERNQFHQKRAAADLGLNYHQFRGYLRKYGLTERRAATGEEMGGDED